ncbi:MAG: hypothetical protein ACOCUU_02145 [Nanoarchaeota archaeon]
MITKKEITAIIITSLILGFTLTLIQTFAFFLKTLFVVILVLLINLISKKITSYYLDSEIETNIWKIHRWGFKSYKKFHKPVPAGIILPLIITALTGGIFTWMANLTFEVKAKTYRAAKRFGLYSFTEMSEFHIALIAVSGILANMFFAIIGYLIGYEYFARINIYYAFFNMLPLSNLDGNKIFFGSIPLWLFIFGLSLVGLIYTVILI